MAHLYLNANGKPVTIHSYSGGQTFRECRRKYKLSRIDGWKEKEDKASTKFGAAIESAIQFFHSNKRVPDSGVGEFVRIWNVLKPDTANWTYTDQEGSWDDLLQMGREMMALYEIRSADLPFDHARFQLSYRKEVFPGTALSGIEFSAYIDMRCEPPWNHPLLPPEQTYPVIECVDPPRRPLLVDIKTAKSPIDDSIPGIVALDPQLREYAWVTGIHDLAFLFLIKARPGSYAKGDEVSIIISDNPVFPLGMSAIVLDKDVGGLVGITTPECYKFWCESENNKLKGKKLEEAKYDYLQKHGTFVAAGAITKQRIQFVAARISEEDVREAGELIGREIADIARAKEENFYPKDSGIRFPNNKCLFCNFVGICTNNPNLRDDRLINIKSTQSTESTDWLEDLVA